MRTVYLCSVLLLAVACGPSSGGTGIKTPEERIAEQERLAEEQERESKEHEYTGPVEETDAEKKAKFDKRASKLELQRATRSAESCVGVVTAEGPTGKASFTLRFANDGHVKEASISAPFDDAPVGKCALNAMKAVIVPPFDGPEETVEWEVDLTPKEDEKKKK